MFAIDFYNTYADSIALLAAEGVIHNHSIGYAVFRRGLHGTSGNRQKPVGRRPVVAEAGTQFSRIEIHLFTGIDGIMVSPSLHSVREGVGVIHKIWDSQHTSVGIGHLKDTRPVAEAACHGTAVAVAPQE